MEKDVKIKIQKAINLHVDSPVDQELLFIALGNVGVNRFIEFKKITPAFYFVSVKLNDGRTVNDLEIHF
jgi:hypothetical protein